MVVRQWRLVSLLVLASVTGTVPVPEASAGSCACDQGPTTSPPTFDPSLPRAHDPVIAKENGTYYVFTTGPGILVKTSRDLKTWSKDERVLVPPPAWTTKVIPGSREYYWAPDISRWDGKWHLYYAISTFGSNHSAIVLATNRTLDPKSKNYKWVDEGLVFQSVRKDNFNAIDPNVAFDEKGEPWLSFGSFWDGLVILPLDRSTGKRKAAGTPVRFIAHRSRENGALGAIEAPFIYRRGGWFYLFASFEFCCRGVNSTYNVRVGRSKSITGPYVDREGKPMMADGGTMIKGTEGRWIGPGHNGIVQDGKRDLMVYHAYDRDDRGASKLRVETLRWDRQGWPSAEPLP